MGWPQISLWPLLWAAAVLVGGALVGLIAHTVVLLVVRVLAHRRGAVVGQAAVKHLGSPSRWMVILAGAWLALPLTMAPEATQNFLAQVLGLGLIALVAWSVIKCSDVVRDVALKRFDLEARDNLQARKIYTQLVVLKRVVIAFAVVLGVGAALMTFQQVRQLGISLLASAGVAGVIAGMAARSTLSSLFAGVQIAIAQPIRLDDVLIVEGEWGKVEEITLTYVVVRLWDLRRLVVPITYFIEKPFQNWTRVTADLLCTVFVYVDYTVPVEAVRQELKGILEGSRLWDHKAWALQVTNTTERSVELRALMSASDASTAWDLRCEVREKLLAFLQANYPQALPKLRVEHSQAGPAGGAN
jgi:small-conductance mechanosensitive channel